MREEDLVVQNPWWARRESILEDEKVKAAMGRTHRLLHRFEEGNFLIVGPRQAGKTTYLKLLVKDLLDRVNPRTVMYFACDLLRDYEEIVEAVRIFDRLGGEGRKYLFLDEVTFVDGWERAVKFILDSPLSAGKCFYITGSSSIGLKRERFPGRNIRVREFMPLDFRGFCGLFCSEELRLALERVKLSRLRAREAFRIGRELMVFFDEILRLFSSYVQSGGYPRAFFELMEGGGISEETYRSCFDATVFDVTKLGRSEKIAASLLQGVLRRYGSKFSLNSLAKETEIGSHLTARDYLEMMEGLCVLRSYHQVDLPRKVVLYRKERKVYFTDPFLCQTFSRVLNVKIDQAQLVEGMIGEHLTRSFGEVHFHAGKRELDFVVGETGVELKWQEHASPGDFPRTGLPEKILLTKHDLGYDEGRNLAMIPAPLFLLALRTGGARA